MGIYKDMFFIGRCLKIKKAYTFCVHYLFFSLLFIDDKIFTVLYSGLSTGKINSPIKPSDNF